MFFGEKRLKNEILECGRTIIRQDPFGFAQGKENRDNDKRRTLDGRWKVLNNKYKVTNYQ